LNCFAFALPLGLPTLLYPAIFLFPSEKTRDCHPACGTQLSSTPLLKSIHRKNTGATAFFQKQRIGLFSRFS